VFERNTEIAIQIVYPVHRPVLEEQEPGLFRASNPRRATQRQLCEDPHGRIPALGVCVGAAGGSGGLPPPLVVVPRC